jgi:hypothetical protein
MVEQTGCNLRALPLSPKTGNARALYPQSPGGLGSLMIHRMLGFITGQ